MDDGSSARRADPMGWGVFAALAAVYRWGRCPSFGPGDSPGLVYRAVFEPGHDPLSWLGHLVSYLPFDTAEGHVNALSGLFHAGAAAFLFAFLRRLGIKRVPALTAAALLAFLPRFWYYSLVAGSEPIATFGLALTAWSVVAWKEEAADWPLALGVLGASMFIGYAPRAVSLIPAGLWCAALLAGLLVSRLDTISPNLARAAFVAAILPAVLRPYDLRQHNPTLEYAEAALESAGPGSRIHVSDDSIRSALDFAIRSSALADPPEIVLEKPHPVRGVSVRLPNLDEPARREFFEAPFLGDFNPTAAVIPKGVLIEDKVSAPKGEPYLLSDRATETLGMPALTSVGLRDLSKYGFTGESILYERYRAILGWYRRLLGPNDGALREKIDRQLADYGPGPGAKP